MVSLPKQSKTISLAALAANMQTCKKRVGEQYLGRAYSIVIRCDSLVLGLIVPFLILQMEKRHWHFCYQ